MNPNLSSAHGRLNRRGYTPTRSGCDGIPCPRRGQACCPLLPHQENTMRGFMGRFGVSAMAGLVLLAAVAGADEKEKAGKKVPLDKVPRKVMDAVKARFPGARITSVEK